MGVAWGQGLLWMRLTSAQGLRFPGGPFHSKSKRAMAGAALLWSWLHHPVPTALALLWLLLARRRAGMPVVVHELSLIHI